LLVEWIFEIFSLFYFVVFVGGGYDGGVIIYLFARAFVLRKFVFGRYLHSFVLESSKS
jgi:hypothetical protein